MRHQNEDRNGASAPAPGTESPAPDGFVALPFGPHGTFLAINGPLFGKREGERLVLGFRVERRHSNPIGICHGGMLMTFADMVLAVGSIFELQLHHFLPTINLTGDFLSPAPLGSWIEGRTQVLRRTRNMVFAQGLVTAEGVPVLRTSGIMKIGAVLDDRLDLRALLGEAAGGRT